MLYFLKRSGLLFGFVLLVVSGTLAVLRQDPSEAFFLLTQEGRGYSGQNDSMIYLSNGKAFRRVDFLPNVMRWAVDGETVFFMGDTGLYRTSVLRRESPHFMFELDQNKSPSLPGSGSQLLLSPQNDQYLTYDDHHLYVLSVDGRDIQLSWEAEERIRWAEWRDEGQSVYVGAGNNRNMQIYTISASDPSDIRSTQSTWASWELKSPYGRLVMGNSDTLTVETLDGRSQLVKLPVQTAVRHWIDEDTLVLGKSFAESPANYEVLIFNINSGQAKTIVSSEQGYVGSYWDEKARYLYLYDYQTSFGGAGSALFMYDPAVDLLVTLIDDYQERWFYDVDTNELSDIWHDAVDLVLYYRNEGRYRVYRVLDIQDHRQNVLFETPVRGFHVDLQTGPDSRTIIITYRNLESSTGDMPVLALVDIRGEKPPAIVPNHILQAVSPIVDKPYHLLRVAILGFVMVVIGGVGILVTRFTV